MVGLKRSIMDLALSAITKTGAGVTEEFIAETLGTLVPGKYACDTASRTDLKYAIRVVRRAQQELELAETALRKRWEEINKEAGK